MLVGTWNLENLMLPHSGDGAPGTEAEYEAKVEALASVITALDPALLGVQEVRQEETLDDLVKAIGGEWHTALSRHADHRGIRVGFLSRTPCGYGGTRTRSRTSCAPYRVTTASSRTRTTR